MNIFLQSWQRAWVNVGARPNDGLRDRLLAAYSEPHRKYHTLQHLAECVEALRRFPSGSDPTDEVEIALWFHDAIYDVKGTDNEVRSAVWAKEQLLAADASRATAERVHDLILVTRHAALPQSPDEQILVDVDLAILGSAPARFAEYESQVRQEYSWVPDELFRRRRREILEAFIGRPAIYSTTHFRRASEAQARENLQRSIVELAGARDPSGG